jgi:hypothetical protein
MKRYFIFLFLLISFQSAFSQTDQDAKFYIGASFGTSYALGDFKDTDITNPDAGFADDGTKLDIYGGFFLNDKVTLTGTFRRQSFDTQIGSLIDNFNADNPGSNFSGNTEDWQVYSVLIGAAYKIPVYKKFALYPRIGIGWSYKARILKQNSALVANGIAYVINDELGNSYQKITDYLLLIARKNNQMNSFYL